MAIHPTARLDPLSRVHPDTEIGERTIVEAGAVIQSGAKIDEDTIIRANCRVRENVRIGAGCDIAAFYVGRDARIGDGVKLHPGSSVGDNATVGDAVHLETGASDRTQARPSTKGPRSDQGTLVHPFATVGGERHHRQGRAHREQRRGRRQRHLRRQGARGAPRTRRKRNAGRQERPDRNRRRTGHGPSSDRRQQLHAGRQLAGVRKRTHEGRMHAGGQRAPRLRSGDGARRPPSAPDRRVRTERRRTRRRNHPALHAGQDRRHAGARSPSRSTTYNFRDNDDDREVRIHPEDRPRGLPGDPAPGASPGRRSDPPEPTSADTTAHPAETASTLGAAPGTATSVKAAAPPLTCQQSGPRCGKTRRRQPGLQ